MPRRWLFGVAIDQFRDPRLGLVPYAESGLTALAKIYAESGIPADRQELVLGHAATSACLPVRLRRFLTRLSRGDQLVVIWAGRGISRDGENLLLAWDTLAEEPEATSFSVTTLFAQLDRSRTGQVGMIWDVGDGPEWPTPGWGTHLDPVSLAQQCDRSRKMALLTTSDPEEESYAAAAIQSRIGLYAVGQCLQGQGRPSQEPRPNLTLEQLQQGLNELLPGLLRVHHGSGSSQSPGLFGESHRSLVIAEISPRVTQQQARQRLENVPWRRVVFRAESTRRVKDLRDWRKQYQRPSHAGASTARFLSRIATADIQAELDTRMSAARSQLGYRRSEMTIVVGNDGTGSLRCPDFEYSIVVTPDADDPTWIVWQEEISGFRTPEFLRGPGFTNLFGNSFDQLQIEFASPLDLASLVDRLEDGLVPGLRLDFSAESCELTLAGISGTIQLDRSQMIIRDARGGPSGLLELFFAFLQKVGSLGALAALPAAKLDP